MRTIAFKPKGMPPAQHQYLKGLGALLSTDVRSAADLVTLAVERLPADTLEKLLAAGLGWDEIGFIIPRRTLSHRREKGEALTVDESDKAIRLARILAQAFAIFGEPARALHWLRAGQQRFAGKTPLELATTEQGARLVEEALVQIDEGYFA